MPEAKKNRALRGVIAVLDKYRVLERTLDLADQHARLAREALRPLPSSELKTLLADIAGFTVSRGY